MIRIPVYTYSARVTGGAVPVLTLTAGSHSSLAGHLLAPDQTQPRSPVPGTPAKLKVPTRKVGEFILLTVAEAVEAAEAREYGLVWEPASDYPDEEENR